MTLPLLKNVELTKSFLILQILVPITYFNNEKVELNELN